MYYRYGIIEVLITNRSEKVKIKVNPAFYLALEMILRFYFLQVCEKRGSVIKIVRPTDLSYIKGERRESITETYEKWNMGQLEGYYDITFVMDVIFNRNICNIIYEGEILLICLVRPTTKNEKITQYDMNTHKTVLILKKRSVQMCP